MSWSVLPPARTAVPLRSLPFLEAEEAIQEMFPNRSVTLLGSGTEALALALFLSRRSKDVKNPEAIIPAYGCPQLISACLWAGVQPRLVDLAPSKWGYDASELRVALGPRTIAIVAVNLLGIGDDAANLSSLARAHGCALIQDSAQHLPRAPQTWVGDYVVLSFGRGKPANALGGGALLSSVDCAEEIAGITHLEGKPTLTARLWRSWLGAALFNALSSPAIFGLLAKVPGTGIGGTVYSPLSTMGRMNRSFSGRLAAVLRQYSSSSTAAAQEWLNVASGWQVCGFEPLIRQLSEPVLRFPVLAADAEQRVHLLSRLSEEGLGVSGMYEVPLNRVARVPSHIGGGRTFANAEDFAARLFTLPTHSLVTPLAIDKVNAIVLGLASSRPSRRAKDARCGGSSDRNSLVPGRE